MKRFVLLCCIIAMLSICVFASPVYKYEDTVPITDTVSLTNVREFHADHNISYSYIKMDLTDDRIKLKLLTSNDGTDVLSNMSDLVKTDENTIAAINGDFFSFYSGNKGFSLGIEKQEGVINQSPINPDTMATVAYDGENILMTYLDFHVMAVAPNWEYKEIRHINKHTSYFGDILMYTSTFNGGYSPAPGGDVLEVVVQDGIITEFRRGMEPCLIPQNGCVLVVSEGSTMFFANNFNVGDEIRFDWYITPSLDDFDTAFGAGSMLVYEGQDVGKVGDYTHTVAGFNPRSAMGIDKDGKTLYLVAVDGRQAISRGMRMSHLAELLIELGCYTAVNLDGGGSTRMLASTLWDFEMHPVNNPSENRKVINAIGIVLNKPVSVEEEDEPEFQEQDEYDDEAEEIEETEEIEEIEEIEETVEDEDIPETDQPVISGIKIKPSKQTAFVGEEVEITVAAHDEQLRQVAFDMQEAEFFVSDGEINDGIFVCDKGGPVTVGVSLGDYYAETTVYYIEDVSGIVTDGVLHMQIGDSKEIPIYVFDYIGRFVKVENTDAFEIVSSDENVIETDGAVLTAKNNGNAVVTVKKDDIISYISIAVGAYPVDYVYDFEKSRGKFTSYPVDTIGSFELSDDFYLSGGFSGKLSFDFTDKVTEETEQIDENEDVSRAVYFSLDEKVLINENNSLVEVKVYSENEFTHEVRAQLIDGTGSVYNLKLDGEIFPGEWNSLNLEVPKRLNAPVMLSRIYVLYTPGEQKDSACIYIDDLCVKSQKDYLPKVVPQNTYRHYKNNSNIGSVLTVSAIADADKNLVNTFERTRVENQVLSDNGIVISSKMKKSVSEDDNAVYVYLDTSNGGIRSTDSSQWELLMQAVKSSQRENLFVIANNGIFGNDEFENEVIRDYLASVDKDVFVLTTGESQSYMNINGVKYFTLDNTPAADFSLTSDKRINAIEFFFGDKVTFEFKSI